MANPFQKVWQLVSNASNSRTFSLLALLLIILAIPLTVFIAQKQQELRQRATGEDITIQDLSATPNATGATFHAKIIDNSTNTGDRTVKLFVDSAEKQSLTYTFSSIQETHEISRDFDNIALSPGAIHNWYVVVKIGGSSVAKADGPSISPPTATFSNLSPTNNSTQNTTSVTLSGSITDNFPAAQQRKVYLVMSHDNGLHEDPPIEILTYTGQTKTVSKTVTLSPGVHLWEFFVQTGATNDRYHSGWNKFTIVQPNQKYKITGTVKVKNANGTYTPFTGNARIDITGQTNHLNIPVTNGAYSTPQDLNPGLYVITLGDIANYVTTPPNPVQLEIWGRDNEDTTADFVITAQTDDNTPITFGDGTPPNNAQTEKRVTFTRVIHDTGGSAFKRTVEVLLTPPNGTETTILSRDYYPMNIISGLYTYSETYNQDLTDGATYSWRVRVTYAGQTFVSPSLSFTVNPITETGSITFSQFIPTNRVTKTNPVKFKVRVKDTNSLTGERSVKFYISQNYFNSTLIAEFNYTKTGTENDQEFPFTKYDLAAGHYWWYATVDIPSRMRGYDSGRQEFNVTGGTVTPPPATPTPTPILKPSCPSAAHYCSAGSTCLDNRFKPDNRYICGDGQSQTCCVLKGNPTPPTCPGECQSVGTWNICIDDDSLCSGGKICKNGTCQTVGVSPSPTKPIISTPTSTRAPTITRTATRTVTSTHTPTATLTPTGGGNVAKLVFTLKFQGVGNRQPYDQKKQSIDEAQSENTDPQTKTRTIKIEIFDRQNNKITETTGNVTYDSTSGFFKGNISVNNMSTGDYLIKVKANKYLRRLIGKETNQTVQHITVGNTPNELPKAKLIVGDIIDDNNLDILDYNQLKNCRNNVASACPDTMTADLNDDRKTDLTDYSWLFNSFQYQYGD